MNHTSFYSAEDFCDSLFRFHRRETLTVTVRELEIGSSAPVRVQSMANTNTLDINGSVTQAESVTQKGGELFRFTAQGKREVEALTRIREQLRLKDVRIPLIADIHFNAALAVEAARVVDKVRINPGNFVRSKAGADGNYTPEEERSEIDEIEVKMADLLSVCREYGTALRIGVNHGSLSARIMSRYGDTPQGMVESAMEFLRVCRTQGFTNVVVSMKSSNVRVMVHAYRLLCAAMKREDMAFPLHLGVTEAGNSREARIKSSIGIGTLLADGIGDTVRVSLTEPPENEIPVARFLIDYISRRNGHIPLSGADISEYSPYEYRKRESRHLPTIGGPHPPVVVMDGDPERLVPAPDYFSIELPAGWIRITTGSATSQFIEKIKVRPDTVLVVETENENVPADFRAFFLTLMSNGIENPVILRKIYDEPDPEKLAIMAAADLGPPLIDGFGDGIWIVNRSQSVPRGEIAAIAFDILQAARVRISRTDYIACPGCGRTLFDLQATLSRIKEATGHFTGLKIGVMGCIVNGPGEMADADYGYVGAAPGKVTLYKGKEIIKKNIPQDRAIEELLTLIRTSEAEEAGIG